MHGVWGKMGKVDLVVYLHRKIFCVGQWVAGFFPISRGLRQGDSLSPYLFVMGMEVLSILLGRTMDGSFISGCEVRSRGEANLNISHLLFVDDMIVLCEASRDQMLYLSWVLF